MPCVRPSSPVARIQRDEPPLLALPTSLPELVRVAADAAENYFRPATWKSALTGYFIGNVAKPLTTPFLHYRRMTLSLTGFFPRDVLIGCSADFLAVPPYRLPQPRNSRVPEWINNSNSPN